MVAAVLHPDGIDPLQKPGAGVDIAGRIDPKALALPLTLAAHGAEDIRPILPKLRRKIHVLLAAGHVPMLLFGAGAQGKAVELPVIEVKPLHKIQKQLFDPLLVNRSRHTDISGFWVFVAVAGPLDMPGKARRVQGVAAARAEPQAKVGRKPLGQRRAGIKLLRKFLVEAPEALAVIIPAVVNHVGVHRRNAVLRQPLFHFIKGADNVFRRDIEHMVVPGIILLAELRFGGDRFDIAEEIALQHLPVVTARCADDGRPGEENAVCPAQAGKRLAGHIPAACYSILDARIRRRELIAQEKRAEIDRLAKPHVEAGNIGRSHIRPRPHRRLLRDLKSRQVNGMQRQRIRLFFREGNLQVFPQEVILLL